MSAYLSKEKLLLIFAAAKKSLEERLHVTDVANEIGVNNGIISDARLLTLFATEAQIQTVLNREEGLTILARVIRHGLTPEQRKYLRLRSGELTAKTRERRKSDAQLWQQFYSSIKELSALPDVLDMIRVVKASNKRKEGLAANLETASNWLKEFMDEWNNSQRGKSAKDPTDTGTGGATTGS